MIRPNPLAAAAPITTQAPCHVTGITLNDIDNAQMSRIRMTRTAESRSRRQIIYNSFSQWTSTIAQNAANTVFTIQAPDKRLRDIIPRRLGPAARPAFRDALHYQAGLSGTGNKTSCARCFGNSNMSPRAAQYQQTVHDVQGRINPLRP